MDYYLKHYGVLGMHWGVHKVRGSSRSVRKHTSKAKVPKTVFDQMKSDGNKKSGSSKSPENATVNLNLNGAKYRYKKPTSMNNQRGSVRSINRLDSQNPKGTKVISPPNDSHTKSRRTSSPKLKNNSFEFTNQSSNRSEQQSSGAGSSKTKKPKTSIKDRVSGMVKDKLKGKPPKKDKGNTDGKSKDEKKSVDPNDIKSIVDAGKTLTEALKTQSEKRDEREYKKKLPKREEVDESISDMSNKEIQDLITRKKLEERYYNEIAIADIKKGKSAATKALDAGVAGLTIASAALGVGVAAYKLKNKNK